MSHSEGDILCGYRLIRQLGEGGMGSVWEAEQAHLGRRVALKIVAAGTEKQEDLRTRFFQEARASAKVEHPNVVQVLDFEVTDDGEPLLVMELLRGESLEERLLRDGPLSLDDARALMTQGSAALAAAHAVGVLHRDIKADNFFVVEGADLKVKLFDFGIARQTSAPSHRITGPLEIFGTPHFMSPEQLLSPDEIDERSDLYGFAVCMYYAITGVLPFAGDSLAAVCLAVTSGEFAAPTTLRRGLPPGLDAFFVTALAREKQGRFADARAMREAFMAASTDLRDTLTAMALVEGPKRKPQLTRSRRAWGAVAALSVLLAAGGLFAHATLPTADADEASPSIASALGDAPLPSSNALPPAPASDVASLVDAARGVDSAPGAAERDPGARDAAMMDAKPARDAPLRTPLPRAHVPSWSHSATSPVAPSAHDAGLHDPAPAVAPPAALNTGSEALPSPPTPADDTPPTTL